MLGFYLTKFSTVPTGLCDCLDLHDDVMANRGFQIKEELMLKFCTLSAPTGARVKAQMTTAVCKTTKDVANLRTYLERTINRIKTFGILKSIFFFSICIYLVFISLDLASSL